MDLEGLKQKVVIEFVSLCYITIIKKRHCLYTVTSKVNIWHRQFSHSASDVKCLWLMMTYVTNKYCLLMYCLCMNWLSKDSWTSIFVFVVWLKTLVPDYFLTRLPFWEIIFCSWLAVDSYFNSLWITFAHFSLSFFFCNCSKENILLL